MSQPNIEAEVGEMESRGYRWDGSEWIKLPNLTKKDLDIILASYEHTANHYRAEKIIHPEDTEYADKMLKKLDQMAVKVIARYHNQYDNCPNCHFFGNSAELEQHNKHQHNE